MGRVVWVNASNYIICTHWCLKTGHQFCILEELGSHGFTLVSAVFILVNGTPTANLVRFAPKDDSEVLTDLLLVIHVIMNSR